MFTRHAATNKIVLGRFDFENKAGNPPLRKTPYSNNRALKIESFQNSLMVWRSQGIQGSRGDRSRTGSGFREQAART
jgi:hypothetical protein